MANNFQLLEMILTQTNSWVMYAEAKNGVTLALSGAALIGTFEVLSSSPVENDLLFWYLVLMLLQVLAALVVSLLSFIPRMEPPWWVSFPDRTDNDNLFYFGDACKYSPGLYLEKITELSGAREASHIESKLSHQVVVNSKIAFIKYKYFEASAWLLISAVLTPMGAWLLSRIRG